MARIVWPRLQLRSMQNLWKAHVALSQVDLLLTKTNWAGAVPCRVLIGNADEVVAGLWNECETSVKRAGATPRAGMEDVSAGQSISEQAIAAELAAAPSKE